MHIIIVVLKNHMRGVIAQLLSIKGLPIGCVQPVTVLVELLKLAGERQLWMKTQYSLQNNSVELMNLKFAFSIQKTVDVEIYFMAI